MFLGLALSIESAAVLRSAVVAVAPANSVLPAITGTTTQGQTLSVSNGTWANTPTSYTYQWKSDGISIGGATANTYLLTAGEVARVITATVTATNAAGSAAATSAATSAVAALTVVSDDFAGGSTVALAAWAADVGNAWVMNSAGPSTGQVDGVNTRATASVASGHYGINPTSPPAANYEVTGSIKNISGDNLPGLLMGFGDTAITGYRVYYQTTTLAGIYFQRLVAGAATALQTIPVVADFTTTTHNWRLARYVLSDRVRLRIVDGTSGQVAVYDDFNAARITAIGFGGVGMRLNSAVVAPFTVKSLGTPSSHTAINTDGARTWYNRPALVDGAYMLVGSVKSDGSIQITKTDGTTHSTTVLSAALQIDDHDDASPLKLSNSKLACFYDKHAADSTIRYRVASNALPDISAFAVEKTITDVAGGVAYTLPFILSDNYVRVYYRQGTAATIPRKLAKTPLADLEAGTESWTLSTEFSTSSQRPYMVACQNGSNRIDFAMTNAHPVESATSIYHCYMTAAAGVESYFKSDGTSIATPIDVVASGTLVDNTTGGRCWNDKIAIGGDGYPRMLFTKYPTGSTTTPAMYQDVEYWYARWTGSAWTKTRLLTGQISIYPAQAFYVGGMCFDGNDVTRIYAAKIVNGIYEIVLLSINEGTGVVTQLSQLTSNSQCHNIRPQSPAGGSRPFAVTWLHGRYTAYTDFETEMRAA